MRDGRRTMKTNSALPTAVGVVKVVPLLIENEDLCDKGNKPTRAVKSVLRAP